MPIKFPNGGFRIPSAIWHNFDDILKQFIEYETALNDHLDDCYIYLTIQQIKD